MIYRPRESVTPTVNISRKYCAAAVAVVLAAHGDGEYDGEDEWEIARPAGPGADDVDAAEWEIIKNLY